MNTAAIDAQNQNPAISPKRSTIHSLIQVMPKMHATKIVNAANTTGRSSQVNVRPSKGGTHAPES